MAAEQESKNEKRKYYVKGGVWIKGKGKGKEDEKEADGAEVKKAKRVLDLHPIRSIRFVSEIYFCVYWNSRVG